MMKRCGFSPFLMVILLLTSFLVVVPVTSADPGGGAYNERHEVDLLVTNPCLVPPDVVHVTGTVHEVATYDWDASGGRMHFHINSNLKGVGDVTGVAYTFNEVFNQSRHIVLDSDHVVVNAHQVVSSQGGTPNFILHFQYRFSVRDGVLIKEETTLTTECLGQGG